MKQENPKVFVIFLPYYHQNLFAFYNRLYFHCYFVYHFYNTYLFEYH